jgi:peptidoglycan hydrolase-like protein with peptidoglycan-binding domain
VAFGVVAIAVAAAAVLLATHGGSINRVVGLSPRAATAASPTTATRLAQLPVRAIADGTAPIAVGLAAPPAPTTPRPWFSPHVAGTWTTSGNNEIFTPTSTLDPCSSYTLTIPAATVATNGTPLGRQHILHLHVACPSIRALQLALAHLGYLPAEFRSRFGIHIAGGAQTRAQAARRAFHPPRGKLIPRVKDAPPIETGVLDPTTEGALMVFQGDHGMTPTGKPDKLTWDKLLAAAMLDRHNREPYTFVTVSESIPETLEVHRGSHVVLSSPTNTGVPGADTPQGAFPIFSRFTSTTMTGTDVDGTHYTVSGVPWVNYFNGGDAVHGYNRGSYGTPQSNGCVELPPSTAQVVYGYLKLGDIVYVT